MFYFLKYIFVIFFKYFFKVIVNFLTQSFGEFQSENIKDLYVFPFEFKKIKLIENNNKNLINNNIDGKVYGKIIPDENLNLPYVTIVILLVNRIKAKFKKNEENYSNLISKLQCKNINNIYDYDGDEIFQNINDNNDVDDVDANERRT